MLIYNRYIAKQLLMSMVLITLTITGIIWLTQSLRFLDLIVNRGLDISTFLYLSSLLIPSLLLLILPVAMLTSVLFLYNKLVVESELIVMNSSGLSRLDLAKPVWLIGGAIMIISYVMSLYVLPSSYREFKDTQIFIRNNYATVLLQEGVFSTPIKGLTIYIESRGNEGVLEGIMVHDSRNQDRPVTMMAQEAKLLQTEYGPRFLLINGSRQEVDNEKGNLSLLYFDSYPLDLSIYTSATKRKVREPKERYLWELLSPDEHTPESMYGQLFAEAHDRIVWPLLAIGLPLVAAAVMLSGQFNRRGQWPRIFVVTLFAIIFVGAHLLLKNTIGKQPNLVALMYINGIIPIVLSIIILFMRRTIDISWPPLWWQKLRLRKHKEKAT